MMWHDQIEACTNAANTSAVWKYFKLSEKDAKIITSTDSERLLSAASASHVTDEKRKRWLLLVTVWWLKSRNCLKARQFGHVLHNSNSAARARGARVQSPTHEENLRWNTMLFVSWSVTFLFTFLKACDTCVKDLPFSLFNLALWFKLYLAFQLLGNLKIWYRYDQLILIKTSNLYLI